jgi:hypothetical protein
VALAVCFVAAVLTVAGVAQASKGGSVSARLASGKGGAVSATLGGKVRVAIANAVTVPTSTKPPRTRINSLCAALSNTEIRKRVGIYWWLATRRAPRLFLGGVQWWGRNCLKGSQRPVVGETDVTSPRTSINGGPAASTTATSASFTFSASEAGSSFACSLDGSDWQTCSSPQSYSGLAPGAHSFYVIAIDANGNFDWSAASRSWTIRQAQAAPGDSTPPQTSITSGPAASTTATSASFSFTSGEGGSSFACRLDGGAWAGCASPKSYSGLAVGTHLLSVRATDAAGNADSTPSTFGWTVVSSSPPPTQPPVTGNCSTTVSSAGAVQGAIDSASAGAVICLANGSYGELSLSSSKPVTVRAANPGAATVAGASLDGRGGVTLARFRLTGEVDVQPGSAGAGVDHNFFDLNAYSGFGVVACPSSTTTCDDVEITNNRFAGESEEDAIRANRYHDTADADAYGLLVEGNEFTGNVEKGDHNDVFQAVWVGDHLVFRNNYLHDFGGQGFFVKDQASAIDGLIAEDNLIVDQDSPCRPTSLCPGFQLSPFQVFGPIKNASIRHNTVGFGRGGGTAVLTGSYSGALFSDNVFDVLSVTDSGGTGTNTTGSNNTRCTGNGWAAPAGTATDCSPAFLNPAGDDYRLANGRGVDWVPSAQHYGP